MRSDLEEPRPRGPRAGRWAGRSFLAALALVGGADPCLALDPRKAISQYSLSVWREDEGLTYNTVQALAQTPDGYLWLGTLEGLVRFDGVRFRTFDRGNTPQIPNNDIQAVVAARDGGLWCAAYGGGVVRYHNGAFEGFGLAQGLQSATVTDIVEDPVAGLWIGTTTGLHLLRDRKFTSFTTSDGLAHDSVRRLFVDRARVLWVATEGGLSHRDGDRFVRHSTNEGLPSDSVLTLAEDASGTLWVGTDRGLVRRDGPRFVRDRGSEALAADEVAALRFDRQGSLWIGTDRRLRRFREGVVDTLTPREGLPDGNVTALLEDREGNLWVATTRGLARLRDGSIVTYSTFQGLGSDEILTVAPARGGGLWVGSDDGKIDRLRDGVVSAVPARELGGSRILALLEDDGGRLWAGSDRGLFVRDGGRWTASTRDLPHAPVRSLLLDRAGALWVGTDGGGLARILEGATTIFTTKEGLPSTQIRNLLQGADGTLWIATYGGLAAYKDGAFRTYSRKDGLSLDLVRSLHEDKQGVLWAGTYGGGINRIAQGRVVPVTTREGLYSDVVYAILEDEAGNLWMSSNRGVSSVSKRDLTDFVSGRIKAVRSIVYGQGDGMRSAECNGGSPAGWKGPDGRLWFATRGGVSAVDPAKARLPLPPAHPLIEEVLVDGQPLTGPVLDLGPDARRVEFRYSGLSFAAPERVRFSFRLEEYDQEWVEAGPRRTTVYTGLSPGDYRFCVRAALGDGAWAESSPVRVRVRAHWYRTGVFYGALCVLLALGVFAAHRLRVHGLEARERELQQGIEDALARLKTLQGLLPICSGCKKIRDDHGQWNQIESYIRERSEAEFTHSICPECAERLYPELARKVRERAQGRS